MELLILGSIIYNILIYIALVMVLYANDVNIFLALLIAIPLKSILQGIIGITGTILWSIVGFIYESIQKLFK